MTARVLVTAGSKRGGTAEIATAIAEALRTDGLIVDQRAPAEVGDLAPYDAVIVGGGLYAHRWPRDVRRFVNGHADELAARRVWMFSSGPLDDSPARTEIPPVKQVARLMARVGARGHATFGGRLRPDARGFPAAAMAKTHAGDWRDWKRIRGWAHDLAHVLEREPAPAITPRPARPSRWPLAALCLVVAVTAIAGGIGLVARPDGSLMNASPSLLRATPFPDFLIPGLLLFVVIGLGNLVAGIAAARDLPSARTLGFLAGVALATWIVAEMILLRTANALQLAYLAVGIAIAAIALRRRAPSRVHA